MSTGARGAWSLSRERSSSPLPTKGPGPGYCTQPHPPLLQAAVAALACPACTLCQSSSMEDRLESETPVAPLQLVTLQGEPGVKGWEVGRGRPGAQGLLDEPKEQQWPFLALQEWQWPWPDLDLLPWRTNPGGPPRSSQMGIPPAPPHLLQGNPPTVALASGCSGVSTRKSAWTWV